MPAKFERCVKSVKRSNAKRGTSYNPWAVCTASVGRKGGKSTEHKIVTSDGRARRLYKGPRGGHFYIKNDRKIYV